MSSCCCALAGTRACLNCPNNGMLPYYWPQPPITYQPISKKKRTIEKYDDKGNITERIIEE